MKLGQRYRLVEVDNNGAILVRKESPLEFIVTHTPQHGGKWGIFNPATGYTADVTMKDTSRLVKP